MCGAIGVVCYAVAWCGGRGALSGCGLCYSVVYCCIVVREVCCVVWWMPACGVACGAWHVAGHEVVACRKASCGVVACWDSVVLWDGVVARCGMMWLCSYTCLGSV